MKLNIIHIFCFILQNFTKVYFLFLYNEILKHYYVQNNIIVIKFNFKNVCLQFASNYTLFTLIRKNIHFNFSKMTKSIFKSPLTNTMIYLINFIYLLLSFCLFCAYIHFLSNIILYFIK